MSRPVGSTWITLTRSGRGNWHWTACIQASDLIPMTYSGSPAMTRKGARRRALRAIEQFAADQRANSALDGVEEGPHIDERGNLRYWDGVPVVGVKYDANSPDDYDYDPGF